WLWLDGPSQPEGRVTGPARELLAAMNSIVLANQVPESAGASGLDTWGRLEEIDVPVTVACGDLDVPVLVERSARLAARLPRATHRELCGVAHLPQLERPDLVAELIVAATPSRS
ncbi:MAG TPA: alpha/beta hydrolase, partial [Acidimicrobiales bacterium]|nr:alpha/beta hydrolase [Acidimicrobiales bacterium]